MVISTYLDTQLAEKQPIYFYDVIIYVYLNESERIIHLGKPVAVGGRG